MVLYSFWYYMATEIAAVPYLGALRLLLIPRNVTGMSSFKGTVQ